jgi:hypothetical protein
MTTPLEQQIRERAYHLWLLDGCPHKRADEHWFSAERQVLALTSTPLVAKKRTTAKKAETSEPSRPPRSMSKRKTTAAAELAETRL